MKRYKLKKSEHKETKIKVFHKKIRMENKLSGWSEEENGLKENS